MRGTTEQDRIEELAQLLDGDLATDDATAHVRSLVQLASTLRDEVALERPDPAFRAALRSQVVEAAVAANTPLLARARDAFWERTARIRHSAKVATATATASMMLGTAGVAAAAQSALPGDVLYGIKGATESLRFAFATGQEETGRLHLTMAQERLDEVAVGIDRLDPATVIETLARMDSSSQTGAEELLAAFQQDPELRILQELQAFAARQRSVLTGVVDRLPLEAKPFAEDSLELLRRIDVALESNAATCDCGDLGAGLGAVAQGRTGITAVGSGPASAADCDCAGADLPLPTSRETGTSGPGTVTEGTSSDGDLGPGVTTPLGDPLTGGSDSPGGTSGSDGSGSNGGGLGVPSDADTASVPGVPSEQVGDTVGGTTDPVEDVVDDAQDTVGGVGGAVGDATEDPTDPIGDVLP